MVVALAVAQAMTLTMTIMALTMAAGRTQIGTTVLVVASYGTLTEGKRGTECSARLTVALTAVLTVVLELAVMALTVIQIAVPPMAAVVQATATAQARAIKARSMSLTHT
jgi:hypothetical protein